MTFSGKEFHTFSLTCPRFVLNPCNIIAFLLWPMTILLLFHTVVTIGQRTHRLATCNPCSGVNLKMKKRILCPLVLKYNRSKSLSTFSNHLRNNVPYSAFSSVIRSTNNCRSTPPWCPGQCSFILYLSDQWPFGPVSPLLLNKFPVGNAVMEYLSWLGLAVDLGTSWLGSWYRVYELTGNP